MNVELLIHAIVRQTTILIAQLATSHGIRAPLAQIADQVFADLVGELDRQGVSRKVSADMFGMGMRTYRRKVQRLRESSTMRGRSLWETVLEYVRDNGVVSRSQIFTHFTNDEVVQVKAVLFDLCESQLLVATGTVPHTRYRATTSEERGRVGHPSDREVGNDLLVALMYREGALTLEQIAAMANEEPSEVDGRLAQLVSEGRIQRVENGDAPLYRAETLVTPLGAEAGWEVAVFDHFKALVATILCRLRDGHPSTLGDRVGGSTYTFEVWDGHPLEEEVLSTLSHLRSSLSEKRKRIAEFEAQNPTRPSRRKRVVIYVGQSLFEEEEEDEDDD